MAHYRANSGKGSSTRQGRIYDGVGIDLGEHDSLASAVALYRDIAGDAGVCDDDGDSYDDGDWIGWISAD